VRHDDEGMNGRIGRKLTPLSPISPPVDLRRISHRRRASGVSGGEAQVLNIEEGGAVQPWTASSSRARSRRPARSRGQRAAMLIRLLGRCGGTRRGVAVRRVSRRTAFTAGSLTGEAWPRHAGPRPRR
jgi:hypothetical protein